MFRLVIKDNSLNKSSYRKPKIALNIVTQKSVIKKEKEQEELNSLLWLQIQTIEKVGGLKI